MSLQNSLPNWTPPLYLNSQTAVPQSIIATATFAKRLSLGLLWQVYYLFLCSITIYLKSAQVYFRRPSAPITQQFPLARARHLRHRWPIPMPFGCIFWETVQYRQVMILRNGLTFCRGDKIDYVNNFTWRYLRLAVTISLCSFEKKEYSLGSTNTLCCSREPSAGRRAALGRIVTRVFQAAELAR